MARIIKVQDALIAGALSLFGVIPSYQKLNPVPSVRILSDEEAMRNDWNSVGQDIRTAITSYSIEHGGQQ